MTLCKRGIQLFLSEVNNRETIAVIEANNDTYCLQNRIKVSGGSRISRRGGVDLVGGGVDSRGGYVSKILYVKMKELGPLGGARAGRAPPRSANESSNWFSEISYLNSLILLKSLLFTPNTSDWAQHVLNLKVFQNEVNFENFNFNTFKGF